VLICGQTPPVAATTLKQEGVMPKRVFSVVIFVATLCTSAPSLAQRIDQMKQFDEYYVFYNLLNTRFLEPEIAEKYDVPRDEDLALLTISVRGPNEEGEITEQPAQVSGVVSDLVQQRPLEFEEYQDPTAVYYLAEVPKEGKATLNFSINVKPKDSAEAYELEFSSRLYPRDPDATATPVPQ
jgi:hypothetical protein